MTIYEYSEIFLTSTLEKIGGEIYLTLYIEDTRVKRSFGVSANDCVLYGVTTREIHLRLVR